MEQQTQEPAPVLESTPQQPSYGGMVALIVIVLVIVGGAYFLFDTRLEKQETPQEAAELEMLGEQSDATDEASIEADLEAQSPEDFEKELDEAFRELDASLQ